MGYYATLEGVHSFRTWCRSEAEIKGIFAKVFTKHPELNDTQDLGYDLVLRKGEEIYYIDIEADEYTRKHWFEEELAKLIVQLIEPGARTYLIFRGEDGDTWGYAITSEGILDVEFICRVNGKLLDDWMNEAA